MTPNIRQEIIDDPLVQTIMIDIVVVPLRMGRDSFVMRHGRFFLVPYQPQDRQIWVWGLLRPGPKPCNVIQMIARTRKMCLAVHDGLDTQRTIREGQACAETWGGGVSFNNPVPCGETTNDFSKRLEPQGLTPQGLTPRGYHFSSKNGRIQLLQAQLPAQFLGESDYLLQPTQAILDEWHVSQPPVSIYPNDCTRASSSPPAGRAWVKLCAENEVRPGERAFESL